MKYLWTFMAGVAAAILAYFKLKPTSTKIDSNVQQNINENNISLEKEEQLRKELEGKENEDNINVVDFFNNRK